MISPPSSQLPCPSAVFAFLVLFCFLLSLWKLEAGTVGTGTAHSSLGPPQGTTAPATGGHTGDPTDKDTDTGQGPLLLPEQLRDQAGQKAPT